MYVCLCIWVVVVVEMIATTTEVMNKCKKEIAENMKKYI